MACSFITKGRIIPNCKNNSGGFKSVSIIPYIPLIEDYLQPDGTLGVSGLTYITTTMVDDFNRFDLKNNGNTFDETSATDDQTFTTIFTGELKLVLPKLDVETKNEIKLLAYARPQLFVETYRGDVILVGMQNGCNLTSSVSKIGGAKTDFQGFELTFSSEETTGFVFLNAAAVAAFRGASITTQIDPA